MKVGEIELAYDYRQGTGSPFVFLHGTTASAATFADVIDAVPSGRELFLFDLRGHGRSAWSPTGDYLIEDHVEDVRRILVEVTGPAVIVGWSLGAMAGLLAAGHDPDGVKGILLGDVTPYTAATEDRYINVPTRDFVLGLGEIVRQLPDHDLDWAVEQHGALEIAGVKMRDMMSPAYIRDYLTQAAPMDPDVPSRQLQAPLSYDIETLLGRVACPVRLVRGNADLGGVVTVVDVQRMQTCCSDFEERYEPRTGHAVHRPPAHQAFAADIRAMAGLVP